MAKLIFTPEELKDYFTGKKYHHFNDECRENASAMRVHFDGEYPTELIDERRPNEPDIVQAYRKKIFVPKTKPSTSKIEASLQKIRRSSDWSIKYPEGSFDRIIEGEKMNDYAEYYYPVFGSLTNWAFSLLLRNYLIDANAIAVVAPIDLPIENEYLKPVVTIFRSCDVIDFVAEDYAVLRNKLGCTYGKNQEGESYYVITTQYIQRYDQVNNRKQFSVAYEYYHDLGELPAFKLGGIVCDVYGMNILYESRISGILPEFNEALREYSDLQAAKVLHLYPERWEYTQNECTNCKGNGKVIDSTGENACQVTCRTCNGVGYIATGPYSKMLIKPSSADQLQVPTPPAGFVEKDVEIIKVQEASIDAHIYSGLAAINFEFLASVQLNQSGTAKEVDRDDLNTTVHSIAEDIVRIMDNVYYYIGLYRYSVQYTHDEIISMLPKVSVPEKFDILSSDYFDKQITSAKANRLNPAIINAMEVSYATKAFNNDQDVAEHVSLILSLDPLAGIGEDDKMSRLSNNGITQLDYIVSSNINKFVNDAVEDNVMFKELDRKKQQEIIYGKAIAQRDAEKNDIIPVDNSVI